MANTDLKLQLSSSLPQAAKLAAPVEPVELQQTQADLHLESKIKEKNELVNNLQQVIASLEEALQAQAS
jgi:hypothetical protein